MIRNAEDGVALAALLVAAACALFILILVHELGHLLAGLAMDFKLINFRVSCFDLNFETKAAFQIAEGKHA